MKGVLTILLSIVITEVAGQDAIPALKVEALVARYKSANGVMVVNFWSTWCQPCIDEIPHFITLTDRYRDSGVQLLLVSQDTRELYESGKLKKYISKKKWKAEVVWLNETDADHYCPAVDKSWSGAIPATVIIHPQRNYYAFFEESLSAAQLDSAIKKAIGH